MIYQVPTLEDSDQAVLALIAEQRKQLRYQVNQNPNRWTGFLRRNTFARALQGSNSIEGYNATLADAVAIVDDERPETHEEETVRALSGYRVAMTYILQMHDDPHFALNAQVIKSLHFMMLNYDLTKLPGQWRPGAIYVVHEPTGDTVYEGPDPELVPALMDELIAQLQAGNALDPIVRGAMAHLNLTTIHPFKDGNGRVARALQTLMIARDGILSPLFSSIEEWLGRNTSAYYDILAKTGQGRWSPERDALPWVRFCLVAHYQQAATLLRRNNEIGRAWHEISKLVALHRLPERSEASLIDATFGFRVRNNRYREQNAISDVVASRDLKRLCDVGLLVPVGEKRGRFYIAAPPLNEIRARTKENRQSVDPYALVGSGGPRLTR
jgi:Fic family protein